MRIAFIVNFFPKLSETFILNQITGLIDRGHEVDIYASQRGDISKVHKSVIEYELLQKTRYVPEIPKNSVKRLLKVFWLFLSNFHKKPLLVINTINAFKHSKRKISLKKIYSIFAFLNAPPYDIIQCHFGPNGLLAIRLQELGLLKGKIITTFHGFDISKLNSEDNTIYQKLFEKGDLFLPISERWKQKLINLGCPAKKIKVHHMGIQPRGFIPKHRTSPQNESINILSIARLTEKKGLEYGIRAVAYLKSQGFSITYKIIGEGALIGELNSLVQQLGLKDTVELVGSKTMDEVKAFLKETDIFLAPSITASDGNQEGIPVCIMEAMASTLPVVSTNHSGIPELVKDNVSGFLVPERDVDGLSEKLAFLIEYPDCRSEMGKAGREYVEEKYDIDKLNDELVEIYHTLRG